MEKLRVELKNLECSAADRGALESAFLERLRTELGGPQQAGAAYRRWLICDAAPKPLELDQLVAAMQWESAYAKAMQHAFRDWPEGADTAFFLLHLS